MRAAGQKRIGIVELAVLDPGRADEHRGAAVVGLPRQRLDGGAARGLEGRLEHQVFRRIAGDEELGKGNDIGAVAGGLRARRAGPLEIAGNVADDRVELRHGNGQLVGRTLVHGDGLSMNPKVEPVLQGSCANKG